MNNKRVLYFDILNIISCISVVFLHCNGIVHFFSNTIAWKQALIIEVICFFAVPIFLMLTGANLLDYKTKYDTKTFFLKRISKVLIPFIIWSYIYFISYKDSFNIIQFTKDFLNCGIEPVFWFFPLILFIYAFMPVLNTLVKEKKIFNYFLLYLLFFKSILPFIAIILNKNVPNILSDFTSFSGYLIFVLLGYKLSKIDIDKKYRIIIYVLAVFSLLFRYFYTFYFSIKNNELNNNLFNYYYINSVIVSVAIFLLIKNINWSKIFKSEKVKTILSKISGCSFGVYLIHMLMKNKLTKTFNLVNTTLSYRLIFPVLLYLLCLTIVYFIKKIPFLKKIVP